MDDNTEKVLRQIIAIYHEQVAMMEKERAELLGALEEIQGYNMRRNDLELYLFDVAEWGLGRRTIRPDPAWYGITKAEA
jgi:hypothetical protein